MGQSARAAAQLYGVDAFVASWRKLYAALAAERVHPSPAAGWTCRARTTAHDPRASRRGRANWPGVDT